MNLNIVDFSRSHIEEAVALARANYEEERRFVAVLPEVDKMPDLTPFADNGLGVAAFENGRLLGFLCCFRPWDNAFGITRVKGTFSPCHANGTVREDRSRIFNRLYQSAAEKWVKNGIVSHAIGLYAHDAQAINSFFVNGFGLRCIDAIRPMEEIECTPLPDFKFIELPEEKEIDILQLNNMLILHFCQSPIFMARPQCDRQSLQNELDRQNSRYFAAYKEKVMVAYVKIMDSGESFISEESSVKNICGAFCLPEYRGMGVYQNLLNFTMSSLKKEGHTRLGVDFESFNPTARGFWLKYFIAYTNSVVRRIDERVLDDNWVENF